MANIDNTLSKLEKPKRTGNGKWLACCPTHDDRSPSLAIKQIDDKILLHCFARCSVAEIVGAIGLELSDLMPDRPTYYKGSKPPKLNKYELFDRVAHEPDILLVAIRQLMSGVSLSQDDKARVKQAAVRLILSCGRCDHELRR